MRFEVPSASVRDGPRTRCRADLAIADTWVVESDRGELRRKLRRGGHEQAETVLRPQPWRRYRPQWPLLRRPTHPLPRWPAAAHQRIEHRSGTVLVPCSGIRNACSPSHDIAVPAEKQKITSQTPPAPLPTEMTSKRAWLAHAAGRPHRTDVGAGAAQRWVGSPKPQRGSPFHAHDDEG